MEASNECSICRFVLRPTEENRTICLSCTTRLLNMRANRDLDEQRRLTIREPLIEQSAVGSQPSEDVDSHILARGRSVDNILHGLPFGDQASPTRGITLNTALDRPERFVLARGVGNPNEETNALYGELQQSRSSTE